MRAQGRRRLDRFLLVLAAIVVGGAAIAGAFLGDTERIGAYWTHAHFTGDHAEVTEVIDYDFGSNRLHGLLRQIPDVEPFAPFSVSSPTAPDEVLIQAWYYGTELRVGDPNRTISNRHRYTLTYPHDGLVFGPEIKWNAVGDGWRVDVHDVEVHITADRELRDPQCDTGPLNRQGGCTVRTVEPGHLVVQFPKVSPGDFLVSAPRWSGADPTLRPPPPVRRRTPAADGGSPGCWRHSPRSPPVWSSPPGSGASAGSRCGSAIPPARRSVEPRAEAPARLVDQRELPEMTTHEFEAPRELSAALGGVIHTERVLTDHKVAWLLESAIRQEIELDLDAKHPVIRRGTTAPNPAVGAVLDAMFGGRDTIVLDSYDPVFAAGWTKLGTELDRWREASGLWERRGARNRVKALVFGVLGAILGLAGVGIAAALANRYGTGWLSVVGTVAILAGGALAALIRSWELLIRSPAGSGAWIRTESFRRFLRDSEAEHVERAADLGLLRQYTAWAVSLGEVDRWERAVDAAVAVPGARTSTLSDELHFVSATSSFTRATSSASTAPSSSGGGGGGGSGGGGGGGGGGSW
ncbi:MAG: DUF2207 domain-containing protein [Acidimicrobiales bacterium]